MTAFEYVEARDAALSIDDPAERRRAYLSAKNKRCYSLIKADPVRYQRRLAMVAARKRARKARA